MSIPVKCKCGRALRVKDEAAGKRVRCPACKAVIEIPKRKPQLKNRPAPKSKPKPPITYDMLFADDKAVEDKTPPPIPPAHVAPAQPQQQVVVQQAVTPSNGLGVAGFVCSILGIFTCGILSPLGVLFSFIALGKEPRGFAASANGKLITSRF